MSGTEIVAFVDEGLGNSSYLVDLGDGSAVVVDPGRDARPYLAEAEKRSLHIAHAIETHLHADFVSGSRELAAHGCGVVAAHAAAMGYPHHGLAGGERLDLGSLSLHSALQPAVPGRQGRGRRSGAGRDLTGSAIVAGKVFSDEEAEQLSSWPPEVARSDLVAHFTLSIDDLRWVRSHRGAAERIGLAVQLCGLGYLGLVRRPIASLNYLLTSHVWRQDHNGFSHQDPGFIDHLVNKKAEIVRVYLPPDTNTLLSVADHCLRSRQYINLIVAGSYLTIDEAVAHCTRGLGIWEWAATTDRRKERAPRRGDGLRRRRSDIGNPRRRSAAP